MRALQAIRRASLAAKLIFSEIINTPAEAWTIPFANCPAVVKTAKDLNAIKSFVAQHPQCSTRVRWSTVKHGGVGVTVEYGGSDTVEHGGARWSTVEYGSRWSTVKYGSRVQCTQSEGP